MASVTEQFITELVSSVKNTFDNNRMYVGLGRSQSWNVTDTPPTTGDFSSIAYARESRASLSHVKVATGISSAAKRIDWVSTTYYLSYDDGLVDIDVYPYYVMNDNFEVFLCVQQGTDNVGTAIPSTIKPTAAAALTVNGGTPGNIDLITDDLGAITVAAAASNASLEPTGYRWRYLFTISPVSVNRFLTPSFFPIQNFTADPADAAEGTEQYQIQQSTVAGEILNVIVENGGTGYSENTIYEIKGNGTSADIEINFVGGSAVSVNVFSHGSGYDFASIEVSDSGGGTGIVLRPVLGPQEGVLYNPLNTLKVNSVIATTDFEDDELDTLLTENDFRQIALIKNPKLYNSSSPFQGNTAKALRQFPQDDVVDGVYAEDEIMIGNSSQSRAIIDYFDGNNIYFHQTSETGYGSFLRGEYVNGEDTNFSVKLSGTNDGVSIANQIDPDMDIFSGELLYIDNITPIERQQDQTEDIKIIITF